jgi:threonine aldolase
VSRSFASDNNSGVHPDIMAAIAAENTADVQSYGEDALSLQMQDYFRNEFGPQVRAYAVLTGTAANTLGLRSVMRTWNSVICSECAHINGAECAAPEIHGRFKIIPIPHTDGKITVETIDRYNLYHGDIHHPQPRVIQITQCTEFGTVYTPEEIRTICDYAHSKGMLVHMDGSRIANAAASLNCSFKELTTDTGVDLLSFGGTKNGLLIGEAVVLLNPELAPGPEFQLIRKQAMQLISKMRFIAAQYKSYLDGKLWRSNAAQANSTAALLAKKAAQLNGVEITRPVQTNVVFAKLPEKALLPLQEKYFFHIWDEATHEIRLMTAFNTTEADIEEFISDLSQYTEN